MRTLAHGVITFLLVFVLFSRPVAVPGTLTAQDDADSPDAILAAMTLEQKVGQMFVARLFGGELTEAGRALLQTWHPGAVVLLGDNTGTPAQVARLTSTFQQTVIDSGGTPMFIAIDQEGGFIARLTDGFTTWPAAMLLTATDDPDLAYRVGQAMAHELTAAGVNMNLAPVADLQTNLDNTVIGRRSPGSDPEQVGRVIAGVIRGMQDAGVMATVKHFPGHGDTHEDSHTTLPVIGHDRARLDTVELVPFVQAIDADVGAVMTGHLWLTEFDPDVPLAASLSHNIVTGLLRESLGYPGVILTDALDMDAIDTAYTLEDAAVRAILAGNDLVLIGAHIGEGTQMQIMQAVVDAVRGGTLDEARVDASVRRILAAKQRFGVLDWTPTETGTPDAMPDNTALVEELFRAGITTAFDTGHLLPLQPGETVGIVYPAGWGRIFRECQRDGVMIQWFGVYDYPDEAQIRAAGILRGLVDKLVIFTYDAYANTAQQALVAAAAGDATIVVALFSPYDALKFPPIGAYVITYSPIDPVIPVVCAMLFGEIPITGRLPVALPGLPTGEQAQP